MSDGKTLRCGLAPACDHPMMEACVTLEQLRAAEKVLEAAEAWYQTAGNGAPVNLDEVLLHQAVEALLAAKEET
ncbi:MAG TPA: hypothetical protein VM487_03930 [Phycisphaerae bacterium]|nr:hypothetical protein [Phycisphaerae bacterium]HUU94865.1 hypothetical protein [Phycisphaerae bacterium]